jgi:ankyrin repeat protein
MLVPLNRLGRLRSTASLLLGPLFLHLVVLMAFTGCNQKVTSQNKAKHEQLDFALFRAASDGRLEVARSLLDSGANVNAREEENETPLMYAAVEGHTDVVLLFLSRGADVNAVSNNKETALGRAAMMGRTETVQALIDKGADVEKGGTVMRRP